MRILPQLQATLNFVAFMANLIDLKHFNTILVLHDQTTRNQINLLIETLPSRYNVAWLLVNEYDNPEYWNQTIAQHQNFLILTALESKNILQVLSRLYNKKFLKKQCKNLIVSSDISKSANEILSSLIGSQINAVLVDWTLPEVDIYAWNPYSVQKLITLNQTEFLRASNAAESTKGKYAGLFFDQLQNMQGRSTKVLSTYDSKNVYNVISMDSVATVEGTEIQLINLIGNAIQSDLNFLVLKVYVRGNTTELNLFKNVLERTYRTYAPIQRRRINILTFEDAYR